MISALDEIRRDVTRYVARATARYEVRFATTAAEIEAAQRLRYNVFMKEFGARGQYDDLNIDRDYFDDFCTHLIALDRTHGDVVGTYRVLLPLGKHRAGRYYMDELFVTDNLRRIQQSTIEIGRACIHADARSSTLLMQMWGVLAQYLTQRNFQYVIGCVSIPDTGRLGRTLALYKRISEGRKYPLPYRVEPRVPAFSMVGYAGHDVSPIDPPALLRGYLQMGAQILGEPAYDEDFACVDIPLIFDLSQARSKLAKRVMGYQDDQIAVAA
jgi:putative hemolysin